MADLYRRGGIEVVYPRKLNHLKALYYLYHLYHLSKEKREKSMEGGTGVEEGRWEGVGGVHRENLGNRWYSGLGGIIRYLATGFQPAPPS
jgi:hypothetical protein